MDNDQDVASNAAPQSGNPLRIAVIGAGDMGRRQMQAVHAEVSCELAAIVDPSPNALPLATSFDAPLFADFEPMINRIHLDGVIIAIPNALHVPLALRYVERDPPVLALPDGTKLD